MGGNKHSVWVSPSLPSLTVVPAACTSSFVLLCVLFLFSLSSSIVILCSDFVHCMH